MTDAQAIPDNKTSQSLKKSSLGGWLLFLKICQALCLALLIFCVLATYLVLNQYDRLIIYDAGLLAAFIFLFLIKGQFTNFAKSTRGDLAYKARLYNNLLPKKESSEDSPDDLIETRERALEYCQELIEDYDKVRKRSRNIYYILQISTILLAGVTPILVVVEQQLKGPDVPFWLQWSPVVFPAIAAIISSFSTSFPLETSWKDAYRVVEQLQAEQEKFILGITKPYRAFLIVKSDEERRKKLKFAIENFIIEVNKIHLQQMGTTDEKLTDDELAESTQDKAQGMVPGGTHGSGGGIYEGPKGAGGGVDD